MQISAALALLAVSRCRYCCSRPLAHICECEQLTQAPGGHRATARQARAKLDIEERADALAAPAPPAAAGPAAQLVPLQTHVADAEREHIRRAMEHTGGSVSRTAEVLGISRKTLWEKMKKLGV